MRLAGKGAVVALALSLGFGPVGVKAQVASPVPDNELAAVFAAFCLDAFPVAADLDRAAAGRKATVMSADEVKSLLHDDPGRGWTLRTAEARYSITIEFPPFNACAVRRMTPVGTAGVTNYLSAVNKYVAAKNGKLVTLPTQKKVVNGADVTLYGQSMVNAGGEMRETFAVVWSNYHGRPPPASRADAGTGVGVEVRFVHQFVK